jgi:hypothetical protein
VKLSKIRLLRYMMECGINDRLAYADADPGRREATMDEVAQMRALLAEFFGDATTQAERFANSLPKTSKTVFQIKKMLAAESKAEEAAT